VPGVVGMAPAGLKDQVVRILGRQEASEGVVVRQDPANPGKYTADFYVVVAVGRVAFAAKKLAGVELSQVRVHVVGVGRG